MNNLSGGFDLISQMVNETFSGLEEDSNLSEELNYIEATNQSILETKESEPIQLEFEYDYFLGAYDQQRKCYIFQIENEVIEFPENWGPFKLCIMNENTHEDLFKIESHQDLDYFFELIENITHKSFKSLKCVNYGTHLKLTYVHDTDHNMAEVIPLHSNTFQRAA